MLKEKLLSKKSIDYQVEYIDTLKSLRCGCKSDFLEEMKRALETYNKYVELSKRIDAEESAIGSWTD